MQNLNPASYPLYGGVMKDVKQTHTHPYPIKIKQCVIHYETL